MSAWKCLLLTLALMAVLASPSEGKSLPCRNSIGGEWEFGRAPRACDLASAQAEHQALYPALVFDEKAEAATNRYMESMHAFLVEAADYYLEERKEKVTEVERLAWRRAVLAMAHQESYWSHYRLGKDGSTWKYMRGDGGHGNGIFQVDDRWHPKLFAKLGHEDLTSNLMYGMDVFYKAWNLALKAKCVTRGNEEQRARAAYAAYNGGNGAVCRWTKAKVKFARNDRGFHDKYRNQEWTRHISSESAGKPSSVDVACVVEGGGVCGRGVGAESAVKEIPAAPSGPAATEAPVVREMNESPVKAMPTSKLKKKGRK